jgi:hypothetical protein
MLIFHGASILLVAHALGRLPEGHPKQPLTDLIFALRGKDPLPVAAAR